jgi:hypothetical protein
MQTSCVAANVYASKLLWAMDVLNVRTKRASSRIALRVSVTPASMPYWPPLRNTCVRSTGAKVRLGLVIRAGSWIRGGLWPV